MFPKLVEKAQSTRDLNAPLAISTSEFHQQAKSPMVLAIEVGDEEGNIKGAKNRVTPTASPQANILKQPDSQLSLDHPGNKNLPKTRKSWGEET